VKTAGQRKQAAIGANRTLGLAEHWRRIAGEERSFSPAEIAQWRTQLREKGFGFLLRDITVEKGEGKKKRTILSINESIIINARELVGIVGETGSGKTTFLRVLLGIEKPTAGEVQVIVGSNLFPISDIPLEALHGEIGYAPQDGYDGHGLPLDEFLGLGATEQDSNRKLEMHEAIERAQASSFLNASELAHERIGVANRRSGGERVRLRLVQALVGNRPAQVWDEPHTGLDTITKNKIISLIKDLKGKKTQLYITHDFSGLQWADKLIVIEKGQPVAFGTPAEMAKKNDHYRELLEMHHASLPPLPPKGRKTF
jgi:ABC-type multidrug transport system fused ATPase/permease subunit